MNERRLRKFNRAYRKRFSTWYASRINFSSTPGYTGRSLVSEIYTGYWSHILPFLRSIHVLLHNIPNNEKALDIHRYNFSIRINKFNRIISVVIATYLSEYECQLT